MRKTSGPRGKSAPTALVLVLVALIVGGLSASSYGAVESTTYYVDSVDGNDANTGLSPANAWKTLAKASTAPLVAGDSLLLERGGSWSGRLELIPSGTAVDPIIVDAYGSGELPLIQGGDCVVVLGSNVIVRNLHTDSCNWFGIKVHGDGVRVESNVSSKNIAGVHVAPESSGAAIVRNRLVDNNRMSVLTQVPTLDDSGAWGVLLNGSSTEVAHNTISGSDAASFDFGRDGSAIEIYGAQGSSVHHNLAIDNNNFVELGNSQAANNSFAQNVVRSSLNDATFLVTRGAGDPMGPVPGTRVHHNSVYLTGASSEGFSCYAGCSASILTMRNNVIHAAGRVGYADAWFDENHDVFSGGPLQFTKGAQSVVGDPRFVNPSTGDLHVQSTSPAVDRGAEAGYRLDFDDRQMPLDGNGDGSTAPDAGAYEYQPAPAADTAAPTISIKTPTAGATVSGVTTLSIDATDNVGVKQAKWFVDGVEVGWDGAGPPWSYEWNSSTVANGTHTLFAKAADAADNWATSVQITFTVSNTGTDTQAPSSPSGFSAGAVTQTTVATGWNAATDNVGVAGYNLYRDGAKVATTANRSYTFSGLACGTAYSLGVEAYDAAGNVSSRAPLAVSTSACGDTQSPSAPGNFVAGTTTQTSIATSWTASSDNVGVTGYSLYRNAVSVATSSTTSYTYTGLACGTTYTLAVEARDAAGNVSSRTTLSAATSACTQVDTQVPTVTVTAPAAGSTVAGSITLSASASDNVGVAQVKWFIDGVEIGWDGSGPPWDDTWDSKTVLNGSHQIFAKAADAANNWGTSAVVNFTVQNTTADTQAPTAPTNFAAGSTTQTSIATSWSAAGDNVGVAGYNVYRNGVKAGTSASTSYTFVGLGCGTSYTLGVEAYDAAGNTSARTSLTASTSACATNDTTPPTVSVTAPAQSATVSGQTQLSANAADNVAVAQVKWFIDDVEVGWDGSQPWSVAWDSTTVADGPHRIIAKAADAANNWATSAESSFWVQNAAPPPPGSGTVIVAAGDVACDPSHGTSSTTCRQQFTADLIRQINPTYVLNLGDAQYEFGTLSNFQNSYQKSWGAFLDKTYVTAGGSHDYYGGGDFYRYFGWRAGPAPLKNWFSFNAGDWHIISLNAQCSNNVGGCGFGSEQERWLKADLAANTHRCTLAMWHNARWSSGPRHGTDSRTDAFWRDLYDAGAEIVLSGHDHDYERFAPQNPSGARDDARGIVQFVVGTGGKSLESSWGSIRPNSLVRDRTTFGVLKLTLRATGYDFEFVPEAGKSFRDSGSGTCH